MIVKTLQSPVALFGRFTFCNSLSKGEQMEETSYPFELLRKQFQELNPPYIFPPIWQTSASLIFAIP